MKVDVIMYSLMLVILAIIGVAAYSMYIKQVNIGYALGFIGLFLFFVGFGIAYFLEKEEKPRGATRIEKNSVS